MAGKKKSADGGRREGERRTQEAGAREFECASPLGSGRGVANNNGNKKVTTLEPWVLKSNNLAELKPKAAALNLKWDQTRKGASLNIE